MATRKQVQDKKKAPTKVRGVKKTVKKPKLATPKVKKFEPYKGKEYKKITKK